MPQRGSSSSAGLPTWLKWCSRSFPPDAFLPPVFDPPCDLGTTFTSLSFSWRSRLLCRWHGQSIPTVSETDPRLNKVQQCCSIVCDLGGWGNQPANHRVFLSVKGGWIVLNTLEKLKIIHTKSQEHADWHIAAATCREVHPPLMCVPGVQTERHWSIFQKPWTILTSRPADPCQECCQRVEGHAGDGSHYDGRGGGEGEGQD